MKIRVIRAFLHRMERQEVGSEIDLPEDLARELIMIGKASAVEMTAAPAAVMTTETSGGLVSGPRKRKGKQDAWQFGNEHGVASAGEGRD